MFSASKSKGGGGFTIANSLRFRSSASAYLSRTPASAGNRQTWTWSGWVKRGVIGSGTLLSLLTGSDGASSGDALYFTSDYIAYFQYGVGAVRGSTAVYRDPSAWYHIVAVSDTTNATAQNRFRIYINGVEITTWTTNVTITQNRNGYINSNTAQYLGSNIGIQYFDGYLAEVNFIDGQALTPSSFGQINATTGVWQPKNYTGTYGTNGFKLNFSNGTSTTTLGYDSSGNSNNWTTNNISLTAGTTYDWMLDSPTPLVGTSYGVGNYAVLNPLGKSTYASISGGNLNISWSDNASANFAANPATIALPNSGKWYFELSNATADGNNAIFVGICPVTSIANGGNTSPSTYYAYRSDANNNYNGYTSTPGGGAAGTSFIGGAICGIAVDLDNGKFWAAINNTWQGGGNPATGTSPGLSGISASTTWVPFMGGWEWTGTVTSASINFGQRPFAYTPPTGYKTLCTQNLPTPSIVNGASYMAATTYTGNGATQSISNAVNSVSFQPDFVWVKQRNTTGNHGLFDSVRGADKYLHSDLTNAEGTIANSLSFASTGFNLGTIYWNTTGQTLVGWQWKAGGTAVTNTAGTITSSVSANTTAGFSVVTWTGNGSGTATVGHGLGVAPAMVITKSRSAVNNWWVAHSGIPTSWIQLDTTGAAGTGGGGNGAINYQNTFTSSVFGFIAGSSTTNNVNANGSTYVAYCFAAIPGYSAFGSYTGNGSTDGPFVYCGFRPRFILFKRTDAVANWVIYDTSRNTYNEAGQQLYPNLSDAESGPSGVIDILSNGFKLRTTGAVVNGGAAIFAAFAENPFQNSLAR